MNKETLLSAIEEKRTELLAIAFDNGLNSQLAIKYSQELDRLLNLYEELHIRKQKNAQLK
ncbi:aspartyl-phosphate phosphatase Spo0E family protein [Domibacillus epiphyticus]|uniref:Spo0A-P phosphatase n=1 Tax=Domibacillus epiphyticus TaxID=1714355 RepID=A0A1V2A7C0_9BACI|nr:aspartyl-phosphate phosphatase Spo0E family protein [Domibacillus epiphyticus]OMP66895.1 Spo0A-P phosphatase [Domibacillus epiphyticus]